MTVAAAAAFAALAVAGPAQAADHTQNLVFGATLLDQPKGQPWAVNLNVNATLGTTDGSLAAPLRHVRLQFPAGARVNAEKFPTCTPKTFADSLRCPKGSKLGNGLAKVDDDPEGTQTKAELAVMVAIAKLMTDDARARLAGDGSLASIPEEVRAGLAGRATDLEAEHRRTWLGRNRPGGLEDSADRLAHLARCYREGRGLPFAPRWAVPAAG